MDKLEPVHDIKSYRVRRAIAPLILSLGTRWRRIVTTRPVRFTPGKWHDIHKEAMWPAEPVWVFLEKKKTSFSYRDSNSWPSNISDRSSADRRNIKFALFSTVFYETSVKLYKTHRALLLLVDFVILIRTNIQSTSWLFSLVLCPSTGPKKSMVWNLVTLYNSVDTPPQIFHICRMSENVLTFHIFWRLRHENGEKCWWEGAREGGGDFTINLAQYLQASMADMSA